MRRRHASFPASPADWVGNYLTQQSVHCVQLLESILEQVHHTADPGMCALVEWSGVRTAVPILISILPFPRCRSIAGALRQGHAPGTRFLLRLLPVTGTWTAAHCTLNRSLLFNISGLRENKDLKHHSGVKHGFSRKRKRGQRWSMRPRPHAHTSSPSPLSRQFHPVFLCSQTSPTA